MLTNPRPGMMVVAWYKDKSMPYHGKVGRVLVAGKGRPRNHLVEIDGVVEVLQKYPTYESFLTEFTVSEEGTERSTT